MPYCGRVGALAESPGGLPRAIAKRGYEQALWSRVALQRWTEARHRGQRSREMPQPTAPTAVLQSATEWRQAAAEGRRLRLPLHPDRQKNWDALGALSAVLRSTTSADRVIDAGSARYSPLLPWLRLYGYERLLGLNLEFGRRVRHQGVEFRYGDVTATGLAPGSVAAVTCLSVIEHGVPVTSFLQESARILRPNGVLVISTDYDQSPPDAKGKSAYGQPVHIFSPEEIVQLTQAAEQFGLRLRGSFEPVHAERPVHWKRQGLHYTCVLLTFDRL